MGRITKDDQAVREQEIIQEEVDLEEKEQSKPSEKISYIPIEVAILEELQNIKQEILELKLAFKKGFTMKEIINALADKEF